jgi:hypothetical protein
LVGHFAGLILPFPPGGISILSVPKIGSWVFCSGIIFLLIFLGLTLSFFISVLAILYMAARVYLVVECFINLAHLPPSTYQMPQRSQYVPHIA